MGQPMQTRNTYSVEDDLEGEKEDMRGSGYIEELRRESYLPDSVHGSQRHTSVMAKNALVLVFRVQLSAHILNTYLQSRMS